MLYEMLAGRLPFEGDSAVSVALKHLSEPPPPISQFRQDVSPPLESVVMAALAKDPAHRWQSADDFAEALQAAGTQLEHGVTAQDTAAFAPVPVPVTEAPPPVLPPPPGEPEHEGGRRWPWFAIGLFTVALVGFLIYLAVAGLTAADTKEVPRVVGKQLLQARQILEREGFEVEESRVRSQAPFDQVVDQDPNPAEEADEGSTVVLEVSGGPGTVRVPTVRGLPQAVAIEALDKRDLKATVDRRPSETIEKGIAIRTVPAAGEEVERGERVQLFVSSGPEQVDVPDVTGLSRDSAEDLLSEAGLEVAVEQRESEEPEDDVISQDPAAGTEVDRGSTVTIAVSTGIEKVSVPNVVGLSRRDAIAQLREVGLTAAPREVDVTDASQDGVVTDQRPAAGIEIEKGKAVVIMVGVLIQDDVLTPEEPTP
jgi:eukaryotic-like serine/threonine-protein kinase